MYRRIWLLIVLAVLFFTAAPRAFGSLSAVGPVDSQKGFPQFYTDSNGLSLDLMEAADVMGISAPVEAGNAFSALIGFGAEGFYFTADAIMPTAAGQAILVQAVEAAFAGETPVDGEQSVFTRIRIRVDVTTAGTYTVTYPFGSKTYTVATPGTRAINDTIDIGCFAIAGVSTCDLAKVGTGVPPLAGAGGFGVALSGEVGPFLTWDTFNINPALSDPALINPNPAFAGRRYIGNPGIDHAVTGSPTGNNFFRVTGPNIGGPGINSVQTNLFAVSGRISTATALNIVRATTNANGTVDVFANSTAAASLTAQIGATSVSMTGDGTGKFFAQVPIATLPNPAIVTVTASNPPNASATATAAIQDVVTVTQADFVGATVPPTLTVTATSSDITAVLTGIGVTNPVVPPPNVTVTSDLGGAQTVPINVLSPPAPPVTIPVAPSALTAAVVGTTASLTWVDNSSNELNFTLQRATNAGFTTGLTQSTRPANATSFSNTGLIAGTTYFYRIRANNTAGSSAYSNTASVTVGAATGVPAVPANFLATPGAARTIVCTWTDGANETSYTAQRALNSTFTSGLAQSTRAANTTSFSFTNLTTGTTYFFRIRANNALGSSAWSVTRSAVAP